MARTFKALSALLTYPTAELQQAVGDIAAAIEAEQLVPARLRKQLQPLLNDIATGDLYDLQERYVLLFDRTRSLSLHLFEHVHGESRDRGQAMIDLKAQYEQNGLMISASELPDFLPLFLEYPGDPSGRGCLRHARPARAYFRSARRAPAQARLAL